MRFIFLFISFICWTSSLTASRFTWEVSAVCIFQNEDRFLKEWIEFHKLVGIQHFYMYNNNSTDNYKKVLQPYIDVGVVELRDWNSVSHGILEWNLVQCSA